MKFILQFSPMACHFHLLRSKYSYVLIAVAMKMSSGMLHCVVWWIGTGVLEQPAVSLSETNLTTQVFKDWNSIIKFLHNVFNQ